MMENNKYYTPTIEEFHVGFEYEERHYDGSIDNYEEGFKRSVLKDLRYIGHDFLCALKDEVIRVPYLSKEDIEELGWTYRGPSPEEYLGFSRSNGSTIYHLVIKSTHVHINKAEPFGEKSELGTSMKNSTIFNGLVKNKSELKQLMKMLDIKVN